MDRMSAHQSRSNDFYPIMIRQSRYSGVYEGGKWHAIPDCISGDTWSMNYYEYLHGDDEHAVDFWMSDESTIVGVGDTPSDALMDMYRRNSTPTSRDSGMLSLFEFEDTSIQQTQELPESE